MDSITTEIERKVATKKCSYIEAVLEFAEENEIADIEDLVEQLHPNIVDKLKTDFVKKKYFRNKKVEGTIEDFMGAE